MLPVSMFGTASSLKGSAPELYERGALSQINKWSDKWTS